jgi:hypothetical protein
MRALQPCLHSVCALKTPTSRRVVTARVTPLADVASLGDLLGHFSSAVASIAPAPLSPVLSTLGSDLALAVDLKPSAEGLGRLAVSCLTFCQLYFQDLHLSPLIWSLLFFSCRFRQIGLCRRELWWRTALPPQDALQAMCEFSPAPLHQESPLKFEAGVLGVQ